MKKFFITYIIFSIVLLFLVYVVTFLQETQKRSLELFYEKAQNAVETKDFNDFIQYQSLGHRLITTYSLQEYQIYIYEVLAQNETGFFSQFSLFVLPEGTINYADELKDPFDQTGLIITNIENQAHYFNSYTHPNFESYAISYGIKTLGFYYYLVDVSQSYMFQVELFDYTGQVMMDEQVTLVYTPYDGITLPLGFTPAYTEQEIEQMLDMQSYLRTPMMINIALFLVVDAFVGITIYLFIKKKNLS
jgi:hypothetical protein